MTMARSQIPAVFCLGFEPIVVFLKVGGGFNVDYKSKILWCSACWHIGFVDSTSHGQTQFPS